MKLCIVLLAVMVVYTMAAPAQDMEELLNELRSLLTKKSFSSDAGFPESKTADRRAMRRIFKDVLLDNDVFSDAFEYTVVSDGFLYQVEGRMINAIDDSYYDIGTTIPNLVSANKLKQTILADTKEDFKYHLSRYINKLVAKINETDPARAAVMKNGLPAVVNDMVSNFDSYEIYATEDDQFELDGMIIPLGYRANGNPYMLVFKDGLEEERV